MTRSARSRAISRTSRVGAIAPAGIIAVSALPAPSEKPGAITSTVTATGSSMNIRASRAAPRTAAVSGSASGCAACWYGASRRAATARSVAPPPITTASDRPAGSIAAAVRACAAAASSGASLGAVA